MRNNPHCVGGPNPTGADGLRLRAHPSKQILSDLGRLRRTVAVDPQAPFRFESHAVIEHSTIIERTSGWVF